jgi:dihydrodipicolinate synthase/N-acetylneuraminate lyase
LSNPGVLAATKVLMEMLGVDVGGVRAPHSNLTPEQRIALRKDLEQLGYFDWLKPEGARVNSPAVLTSKSNGH